MIDGAGESRDLETNHSDAGGRKHDRFRERLIRRLGDESLVDRFLRLREVSARIRSREYHLTNACNIRCQGCWFFEYGIDRQSKEVTDLERWRDFARDQASQGVTAALLIGGEPTLVPDRVAAFASEMDFVTISSNGLREFPRSGFERVNVALTLFGGAGLDDQLRAIKPGGQTFRGLFGQALRNYKDDPRAIFIYALDPEHPEVVEDTVRSIGDNGNIVNFNYYSRYGVEDPLRHSREERLLDVALDVASRYPDVVASHPYFTRALITGRTEWGAFGYDSCPSISVDHPAHSERLQNSAPVLPGFNVYSADLETLQFCCTSGHCDGCRDSQAVYSWLLTNVGRFIRDREKLRTWVELAEGYWSQFVWSDYHRSASPHSS